MACLEMRLVSPHVLTQLGSAGAGYYRNVLQGMVQDPKV